MTVNPNSLDLPALLETHLQQAEPGLARAMLTSFAQALMSARGRRGVRRRLRHP